MKKILILTANPKNTDKLRLDEEVREIQEGLQRFSYGKVSPTCSRDQFEIISMWAVRPDDLRRALLDHEPHIVHFSGHGAGSKGLVLENNAGQMKLVSGPSLARLFKLFKHQVECVLLNACYSEVQAAAIHQHIDCVIGLNKAIGDRSALKFSVGFYDGLGAGRPYGDAFEFGVSALDLEESPETATPQLKQRLKQRLKQQPSSSSQDVATTLPAEDITTTDTPPTEPSARLEPAQAETPSTQSVAAPLQSGARSRIFISYKRDIEIDERIALEVYAALSQSHDVFIDQAMAIGTPWAERIEQELRRSDFLITFLSGQSIHSEIVLGEIETAHRLMKESGQPVILPVRLAYRDPFVYPLSAYLNPINWAFWGDEADTPQLIEELMRAISGESLSIDSERAKQEVTVAAAESVIPRPQASAQPIPSGGKPTLKKQLKSQLCKLPSAQPDSSIRSFDQDWINTSVFSPRQVVRDETFLVQVFTYLPEQIESVKEMAQMVDETAEQVAKKKLGVSVTRDIQLFFELEMPGLEIDAPIQSLRWQGNEDSVAFGVTVPMDISKKTIIGTVTVSQQSVPLGHLKFKVMVSKGVTSDEPTLAGESTRRYQKAFVSYSSQDRAEVLKRVQGMQAVSSIEVFQDLLKLEPGQRWEKELYKQIDECDLFLLFWSRAAKASKWVLKETEYALALQHKDNLQLPAIKPVILEGPPIVKPPKELQDLHFNDILIYLITQPASFEPGPSQQVALGTAEGTMDPESKLYVTRECDAIAQATIQRKGVTITIKGPRQMGKSSLLMQVIDGAMRADKQVVFLDFQLFDQNVLKSADAFYPQFCQIMTEQLGLPDKVAEYWEGSSGNVRCCTRYMQTHILKEVGGPLVLAMDEVDRMFDADYRLDFFGMLRSWHNNRALPMYRDWKQFDLALVTATEPYHLIANWNQSPFNVGEVLLLKDFSAAQVTDLNQRHGNVLTPG